MARQGYDLQLASCDEQGWRATFYVMGWPGLRAVGELLESVPDRSAHREKKGKNTSS